MSTPTSAAVPVAIAITGTMLPCAVCGLAVDGPHLKADVTEHQIVAAEDQLGVRDLPQPHTLATTRCRTCRDRRDEAEVIASEHPQLTAWLGSRSIVVDRLEAVLVTATLAGGSVRMSTRGEIMATLGSLVQPGVAALWVRRFVPVQEAGARRDSANAKPFQHVAAEIIQAARDAMAALLRSRIASVIDNLTAPPADGPRGCLLCGIGSARTWYELTASTRSLGGRPSPEPIEGYACATCEAVLHDVGSIGQTALRRALFQHLGITRTLALDEIEMHVLGWGALRQAAPSASAWQHVDVEALRRDLADVEEFGYVNRGVRR